MADKDQESNPIREASKQHCRIISLMPLFFLNYLITRCLKERGDDSFMTVLVFTKYILFFRKRNMLQQQLKEAIRDKNSQSTAIFGTQANLY